MLDEIDLILYNKCDALISKKLRGEKMKKPYKLINRRQFVRLSRYLPTEVIFFDDTRCQILSPRYRGIIRNISAGGVLLELDKLDKDWIDALCDGFIKLALEIKLPTAKEPVIALAKMIWISKPEESPATGRYLLGLHFVDITTDDQDKIRDCIIKSYYRKRHKI